MAYSSIAEVELILPQALTSARPDDSDNKITLINIGEERDINRIDDDLIYFYMSIGDQTIDGIVSQMYQMPIQKCVNGQWDLDTDINEYNQLVEVSDAVNLVRGDEVVIRNDNTGIEEQHIVNTIVDQNTFTTVSPILSDFEGSDIRVFRLQFPPPISEISARLTVSYIYDKYFSAQNSPNISEYGLEMRKNALGKLNDILNGRIILRCQRRIGDQWGNPWLDSNYSLRESPGGFDPSSRDMSRPQQ